MRPNAVSSNPVVSSTLTVTVGDDAPGRTAAQNVRVRETASSDDAPRAGGQGPRRGGASAQGRILEIGPDGAVTSLWQSGSEMAFALLSQEGGRLLFSTGTKGRVYTLEGSRLTTLLVESTEEQTTGLLSYGDRILATSSNAGRLFELGDAAGASGSYESIVRNTGGDFQLG